MFKRIGKGLLRAGEILTGQGPTPVKQLQNALLECDEEKSIQVYTTDKNGIPIPEDELVDPSTAFPSKKLESTTPLHLAAQLAFADLVTLFLKRGGDPSTLNLRLETCLHTVCSQSDNASKRLQLLELFLRWRSPEVDGEYHSVSLNRVDVDGNAALHYAASSGLVECVVRLLGFGAIISIVNKEQRTCCEMADIGGFKDLASMLELALVFQPEDEGFVFENNFRLTDQDDLAPLLVADCHSMYLAELELFVESTIDMLCCIPLPLPSRVPESYRDNQERSGAKGVTPAKCPASSLGEDIGFISTLPPSRAEALLDAFNWDVPRLKRILATKPWEALAQANLQDKRVEPPVNSFFVNGVEQHQWTENVPITVIAPQKDEPYQSQEKAASNTALDLDGIFCLEVKQAETAGSVFRLPDAAKIISTGEPEKENEGDKSSPLAGKKSDQSHDKHHEASALSLSHSKSTLKSFDEVCAICCETMLPPVAAADLLVYDLVSSADVRAVYCCAGHVYCLSCWSQHVSTQVRENAAYALQCPGFKCRELLGQEWGKVLLKDPVLYSRWRENRVRHVVDCSKALHWCRHEGCELVVHILPRSRDNSNNIEEEGVDITLQQQQARGLLMAWERNAGINLGGDGSSSGSEKVSLDELIPRTALCDNGHAFCLRCESEAHAPCSCEDWKSWKARVAEELKASGATGDGAPSGDEVANLLWVAANTKKCPRCSTAIEKDEGCNHMSCRKCRHEFCWICMQDWTLHSSSTGGFFQCNRYVASDSLSDGKGGSSSNADPSTSGGVSSDSSSFSHVASSTRRRRNNNNNNSHLDMFMQLESEYGSGERGNAHAETMRLRERNRRMERFIHHYTRFQAQFESANMEKKTYWDAVERIHRSLQETAIGKLRWLQGTNVVNPYKTSYGTTDTPDDAFLDGKESSSPVTRAKDPSSSPRVRTPVLLRPAPVSESSASKAAASSKSSLLAFAGAGPAALLSRLTPSRLRGLSFGVGDGTAADKSSSGGGGGGRAGQTGEAVGSTEAKQAATRSLDFLGKGFHELLRCRYLLRATFPFAFYAFSDDGLEELQQEAYSSGYGHHSILAAYHTLQNTRDDKPPVSEYPGEYLGTGTVSGAKMRGLTSAQRLLLRGRSHTRRLDFEDLQSQLEMLTEMLSDVVARRRLRASNSQITQATRAARQKRAELEQLLHGWIRTDTHMVEDILQANRAYALSHTTMASSTSSMKKDVSKHPRDVGKTTSTSKSFHRSPSASSGNHIESDVDGEESSFVNTIFGPISRDATSNPRERSRSGHPRRSAQSRARPSDIERSLRAMRDASYGQDASLQEALDDDLDGDDVDAEDIAYMIAEIEGIHATVGSVTSSGTDGTGSMNQRSGEPAPTTSNTGAHPLAQSTQARDHRVSVGGGDSSSGGGHNSDPHSLGARMFPQVQPEPRETSSSALTVPPPLSDSMKKSGVPGDATVATSTTANEKMRSVFGGILSRSFRGANRAGALEGFAISAATASLNGADDTADGSSLKIGVAVQDAVNGTRGVPNVTRDKAGASVPVRHVERYKFANSTSGARSVEVGEGDSDSGSDSDSSHRRATASSASRRLYSGLSSQQQREQVNSRGDSGARFSEATRAARSASHHPTYSNRISVEAGELAALNRAILMSLQDLPAATAAATAVAAAGESACGTRSEASDKHAGSQGAIITATTSDVSVNEDDVEMLAALGFGREDSVAALRAARMNVDAAAEILLNAAAR